MTDAPVPKLGAIAVVCHQEQVILVQRGKAPRAGMWGFPGGHVELGETAMQAAVRELHEETGVTAVARQYLTNVDVIVRDAEGRIEAHYLLAAVLCDYVEGTPLAADDAADAGWFAVDTLSQSGLPMLSQVEEVARLAFSRMDQARRERA